MSFQIGEVNLPDKMLDKCCLSIFNVDVKGERIATLGFQIPKVFGLSRREVSTRDLDEEKDQRFPFEEYPNRILFSYRIEIPKESNQYNQQIRLGIVSNLFSVSVFGNLFQYEPLKKAVSRYLFNTSGPGYFFGQKSCALLRLSDLCDERLSLCFEKKEIDKDLQDSPSAYHTSEYEYAYCTPISPSHFIVNSYSIYGPKFYDKNQVYQKYIKSLANRIEKKLDIRYNEENLSLFKASKQNHPKISKTEVEPLNWPLVKLSNLYSLEREMLKSGEAEPKDCFHTFSEEDLESNVVTMYLEGKEMNFLEDTFVLPEENFSGFTGKFKVPRPKDPNNPIQRVILKEMEEYYQVLTAEYKTD